MSEDAEAWLVWIVTTLQLVKATMPICTGQQSALRMASSDKVRNWARSPARVSCSSSAEIHGAVPGCTSWESGNCWLKLNKLMHLTAAVKGSWTSAALPLEELLRHLPASHPTQTGWECVWGHGGTEPVLKYSPQSCVCGWGSLFEIPFFCFLCLLNGSA